MKKRILSLALALVLIFSLAATTLAKLKGDINNDGTVNSSDALSVLLYAVGSETEIDTVAADMNSDGIINSSDALTILRISVGLEDKVEIPEDPSEPEVPDTPEVSDTPEVPDTPDTPATPDIPQTVTEVVDFYNSAINKAVNEKAGYNKARTTEIKEMNGGALMKIQLVVDMVNEFLGVGTTEYTNAKGQSKYLMNASLTKDDLSSVKCIQDGSNLRITLSLKNGSSSATKSTKKDTSALARSGLLTGSLADPSYDYLSSGCVYSSIMGADASVSVESVKATNSNVKLIAVITPQGQLVSLNASYDWTVEMTKIKYSVVTVKTADGKAHTEVEFSDFQW